MNLLKKVFSLLLIVLTLNLYFPKIDFAQEFRFHAKAAVNITSTEVQSTLDNEIQSLPEPEIRSTPEKDIPGKKSGKWLYILVGILAVAGIGAAAGGGNSSSGDTGGMDITW